MRLSELAAARAARFATPCEASRPGSAYATAQDVEEKPARCFSPTRIGLATSSRCPGSLRPITDEASARDAGPGYPSSRSHKAGRRKTRARRPGLFPGGPFDRTICWTHDEQSTEAPLLFAAYTSRQFFQVLSSSYADPAKPAHLTARRHVFEQAFPGIEYHTVVLGFGGEVGGRSRWLSHGEISNGVLQALVEPGLHHVVGRVAPWDARP